MKARAAFERVTLKQLLRRYVEQGLSNTTTAGVTKRSADTLPRLNKPLATTSSNLNNASLFESLDA